MESDLTRPKKRRKTTIKTEGAPITATPIDGAASCKRCANTPSASVALALQPMVLAPNRTVASYMDLDAITRAHGPRPVMNQACPIFFHGCDDNGSIVAKNRDVFFNASSNHTPSASALTQQAVEWIAELDGATPLSFTLGIGEVIESWDLCVANMFKNESATIITRDENRQVFVYELQLVDFW
jgi:hypothetical protein